MFSKPDNWDFSLNGLKSQLKEGRDSISGALKELEKYGYLSRIEIRNDKGQFKDYDYWITDDPNTTLPNTENPTSGNQLQVNTNLSKDSIKVNTKEDPKTLFSGDPPEKPKKEFDPQVSSLTLKLSKKFPEVVVKKLTSSQKIKWVDTVDKLLRIDKYSAEEIERAVENGRSDRFWETNFLSINKLRNKNKEGLMYIQVFLNLKSSQKLGAGDSNYVEGEMTKADLL